MLHSSAGGEGTSYDSSAVTVTVLHSSAGGEGNSAVTSVQQGC